MAAATTTGALTQQQLLQAIAPQTSADQLQVSATDQQLGLVGPETAQNVAYANALAGIQTSQYGITQQQNTLQQQEGVQQGAQNVAQQGIEQTGYGLQQGAIGIQGQQLGVQQQQLNLAYNNAVTGQQNQGAAAGTTYTHGQQQAMGTLQQNQNLSTQALGLQGSLLGNQSAQAANTQAGEESGFGYTQQQLANSQQNLQLIAEANGLSQQQAMTMLSYQGQQAGLQGQQQTAQLEGQKEGIISGNASTIESTLGAMAFAGGSSGPAKK
jgi:hypothetical protein